MRMGSPVLLFASLALFAAGPSRSTQDLCEPSAEVERAIVDAVAAVREGASYEERIDPLRAVRDRFERDLFVHLRYQDAIFDSGIEGHLKEMLEEYLQLERKNGGGPFYLYLLGRAFEGRGTRRAIAILEQVLALDPDFAPAHRTLAEIHGSKAFADPQKEMAERRKFAAACPKGAIARRPTPLPPHSTFFARLQETRLSPEQEEAIPREVHQALLQDEGRAQRIRLFDWYTPEEQLGALRGLQAEYWQAWRVLVRHYRRTGREAQADELLAEMEERLVRLQTSRRATTFPLAARTVLGLHAEAKRWESVRAVLARLSKSLGDHPDPKRAAELAHVQAAFASAEARGR
jgi:hypothetical protein